MDLGNYERYLGIQLSRDSNMTTGKVYKLVIDKERRGDYLGKTVQVVPHITDAMQDWLERVAKIPVDDSGEEPDVCISMFPFLLLDQHGRVLMSRSRAGRYSRVGDPPLVRMISCYLDQIC